MDENLYKILQCSSDASTEELKVKYQELVLLHHPDKSKNMDKSSHENFIKIQKAWTVLKDTEKRKKYDAELQCKQASGHLIYETLKLSELDLSKNDNIYTYPCRCGGKYLLEGNECHENKVIIECEECSFSILVNMNW